MIRLRASLTLELASDHLEGLLKHRVVGPIPEFLIQ